MTQHKAYLFRDFPISIKVREVTKELEKYLVDAPSAPQAQSASLLGATLITIGLTLLTLVILGFLGI